MDNLTNHIDNAQKHLEKAKELIEPIYFSTINKQRSKVYAGYDPETRSYFINLTDGNVALAETTSPNLLQYRRTGIGFVFAKKRFLNSLAMRD
jgi:alpha-D-ribose 1-methylphosphonate 5-triphosphate synthase subunit PhnL